MLLFQFEPVAEQWLTADGGANFRAWSDHPDFDAVYAEVIANGSLTPALNYYRANINPARSSGRRPIPPIRRPRWACSAPPTSRSPSTDGRVGRILRDIVPRNASKAPDTGSSGSNRTP